MAFHLLNMPDYEVENLAKSLLDLKQNIVRCSECGGISDSELCPFCSDYSRERGLICVVGDVGDVFAIESSSGFRGLYHVLGGLISPLDGVGPDDINVKGLVERCSGDSVSEVIFALNSTIEGEATTLYVSDLLKPLGVGVSRIARGLPMGTDLEFADSATIASSIEGRVKV